jgi:anti-anti-sigma regulatory factor
MTVIEQSVGLGRVGVRVPVGGPGADRLDVSIGFDGDSAVAALSGDLSASTVPALLGMTRDLMASGHFHLVLDCRRLYTVDARGLAGLYEAQALLEGCAGSLVMTGVRPQVRATLNRHGSAVRFGVGVGADIKSGAASLSGRIGSLVEGRFSVVYQG